MGFGGRIGPGGQQPASKIREIVALPGWVEKNEESGRFGRVLRIVDCTLLLRTCECSMEQRRQVRDSRLSTRRLKQARQQMQIEEGALGDRLPMFVLPCPDYAIRREGASTSSMQRQASRVKHFIYRFEECSGFRRRRRGTRR